MLCCAGAGQTGLMGMLGLQQPTEGVPQVRPRRLALVLPCLARPPCHASP